MSQAEVVELSRQKGLNVFRVNSDKVGRSEKVLLPGGVPLGIFFVYLVEKEVGNDLLFVRLHDFSSHVDPERPFVWALEGWLAS